MGAIENDIVIKDACILFDLIDLGLLDLYFELNVTTYSTAYVVGEIEDEQQWAVVSSYLNSGHIKIDELGNDEEIFSIHAESPGLSLTDSSILELAARLEGIVLSSDGGLRNVSKRKGLEVRGLLWVIEQLVEQGIIGKSMAIEKLEKYPVINQRAPVNDIEVLIHKLVNG